MATCHERHRPQHGRRHEDPGFQFFDAVMRAYHDVSDTSAPTAMQAYPRSRRSVPTEHVAERLGAGGSGPAPQLGVDGFGHQCFSEGGTVSLYMSAADLQFATAGACDDSLVSATFGHLTRRSATGATPERRNPPRRW